MTLSITYQQSNIFRFMPEVASKSGLQEAKCAHIVLYEEKQDSADLTSLQSDGLGVEPSLGGVAADPGSKTFALFSRQNFPPFFC
jgi:hypothetical protein